VIVDNVGGHLMQHEQVDLVITGSDRTTYTGDVANKIGTYLKALAARDNDVPFYVALPSSTIDWATRDGVAGVPIEERDPHEVTHMDGAVDEGDSSKTTTIRLVPAGSAAANHAFDVTPSRLVTGLITERGVVAQAPNLTPFEGADLGPQLQARLGVPVTVDNDVNAALRGEHRLGAARGCRNVIMLSLGTGVGGGVVVDDRFYRGSGGMAGELGHTLLDHEGPMCTCGKPGHVEAYLSTEAIRSPITPTRRSIAAVEPLPQNSTACSSVAPRQSATIALASSRNRVVWRPVPDDSVWVLA